MAHVSQSVAKTPLIGSFFLVHSKKDLSSKNRLPIKILEYICCGKNKMFAALGLQTVHGQDVLTNVGERLKMLPHKETMTRVLVQ